MKILIAAAFSSKKLNYWKKNWISIINFSILKFFYTMVKVFQGIHFINEGSQYIQILFKFGQHYKLTQKILS